ncbi:hypothetical protein BKA62DRAFT_688663 [Auriculariales sp. MPI-PUGE-AT-0066]|nr:hypothetical protein BKA62DRAFT_688663 [Auriculariales sp. MPI-PUGE-AT-0066]
MPPTPGQFALPPQSSSAAQRNGHVLQQHYQHQQMQHQIQTHPVHAQNHIYGQQAPYTNGDMAMQYAAAGPSHIAQQDDSRNKERRRREGSARQQRQEVVVDRSDAQRVQNERVQALALSGTQLFADPGGHPEFVMRLLPHSIERTALLNQINYDEAYGLENARMAWEEERERVDTEWRKGVERIKERLLEGIEERRRRAREEKEGEGVVDSSLDGAARPHVTRKLRNKLNPSPPPTPSGSGLGTNDAGPGGRPVLNPHSLAVEELPSPFPLTLTDVALASATGAKRAKKTGAQIQSVGFGRAIQQLTQLKDGEIDADLGEIRRSSKKRRTAAPSGSAMRG